MAFKLDVFGVWGFDGSEWWLVDEWCEVDCEKNVRSAGDRDLFWGEEAVVVYVFVGGFWCALW